MSVSTRPAPAPPSPARSQLGVWLRQGWREFRSMRTALVLLFVLAAGSVFGSLFPQRNVNPDRVAQYLADHRAIAPLLDRLGLFDVFGSPWYMAIYLALVAALLACLVPRTRALVRLLRARPPRGGRLERYRNSTAFTVAASPQQAVAAARRVLAGRRFRVVAHGAAELAAEKGYLREVASLVFHVALLVLLVGLAYGKGFGYRGQVTLDEGRTLANSRLAYDSFVPGRFFTPDKLAPFALRLDRFTNSFYANGVPREFASTITAFDLDGRQLARQKVAVNRPMTVDGVRIFQSDYGYEPWLVVTGPHGQVLADQPVLSLRDPASEISSGAVKLTMLKPQVGLQVTFFTGLTLAPDCPGGAAFCNDPRLVDPVVVVWPFQGDLHADRGQSVYALDLSGLRRVGDRPLVLPLGRSGTLPGGLTVAFKSIPRYSVLTLAKDPGAPVVLAAALLILAGLVPSLHVRRRRVWVRATPGPDGTRVEMAGLALQGKAAFADEFADLTRSLRTALRE